MRDGALMTLSKGNCKTKDGRKGHKKEPIRRSVLDFLGLGISQG